MAGSGSGTTTSATVANVVPTVISAARELVEKPTVMSDKNVVTKRMIKDGDGLTYNWPKFGTNFAAQSLTEAVAINNPQTLIPSTQQFTTSEIGVMFLLTDRAKRVTNEDLAGRGGRFMGNAIRRNVETTGLGLFSGLSRDLGAAGNSFNPNFIAAAKVRLRSGTETNQTEPVSGEITAIVQPYHIHDILTSSGTLGTTGGNENVLATGRQPIDGWTEELVREYDIKRVYGVNIAGAPLITIDGSDDAVGAIFSNMAFLYVGTSNDMHVEKDRDISLRAEVMVMTKEFGFAELEDQFGFAITADASVPTS